MNSPWWVVAAFLLLACGARAAQLHVAKDAFTSDRDNYRELAQNLLAHRVLGWGDRPTAYRPPLYPLCLAAAFTAAPPREAALGLHLGLGVGAVLATYLAARWLELGDGALLAALFVAFDPLLLHQSTLFMTETLATFLAALAWMLLVAQGRRPRIWLAAAAGVTLGLAALTRPTFLMWWAPLSVVALVWGSALGTRRAALAFAAGAAACLLPWTARNQLALGAPTATTTHGGYTLLLANNPEFYEFARSGAWGATWSSEALDRELLATLPPIERPADELARDRKCHELAVGFMRADPRGFAWSSLVRFGAFWGLVPHHVGAEESRADRWLRYSVGLWYGACYLLALAGLAALGRRGWRPPWLWALLAAAAFSGVHAVYWSNLRMRAPLTPMLACAAALGARACWRRWGRSKSTPPPNLDQPASSSERLDPAEDASL